MSGGLFERLEAQLETFTASERAIASFILAHRGEIAFETAASVAERLGVSAITVGRFCRRMGYRHFKALKQDLKHDIAGAPWLGGDQLAAFAASGGPAKDQLKHSLDEEIRNLVEVYSMVGTPAWEEMVTLLMEAETINVAGFQTERGLALQFAHHLQYIRDGVRLADASGGTFSEIFLTRDRQCLVVFESRRYSREAYQLCELAHERKIPLILVTDKYCDWGRRFTPHVLMVPSDCGLFWTSQVASSCAINLLCNSIVARLGNDVEERLEAFSQLFQRFVGHVGQGGGPGKR